MGTNKWGRISFSVTRDAQNPEKRISRDYVQYFREGDIEIINGSFLSVVEQPLLNVEYVVEQVIAPMLGVLQNWMNKVKSESWMVEIGIDGIEKYRLTRGPSLGGPIIHVDRVSVQKEMTKDTVMSLKQEFQSKLLAEGGFGL